MAETNDRLWEKERLSHVRQELQDRLDELEPQVTGLADQAADIRKRFWEEVTINTGSYTDFEEAFYTINQQSRVLAERERVHKMLVQQWKSVNRLLPSPYFGRIDFKEKGINFTEQIYIGVSSFTDKEGLNFLIYDWRTPIASLYYDHASGPSSYETLMGRIEGNVELKRQFQIQGGQLLGMFDASETIGDALLQEVLSKGASSQMKSIVATIQKEQNAIIRDDRSRMLIVQGAAGSGKTSAVLQRVAYLLYKHRETVKADQMVLFSPNPMFASYISTVLPELGEENIQQTTFQEYLNYWLGSSLCPEDPLDQMEYVLTAGEEAGYAARLEGIRYKASAAFLEALKNYGQWLGREGIKFVGIRFREREFITSTQMRAQFSSYDEKLSLPSRILLLQEWLLKELTLLEKQERHADWVKEELNYLDADDFADVYRSLHKEKAVFEVAEQYAAREHTGKRADLDEGAFDFVEREEELLRRNIVKQMFKPLRQRVRKFKFVNVQATYEQLFVDEVAYKERTDGADVPPYWDEICKQTINMLHQNKLFHEDATPYLYVKEIIEGVRVNTDIRYVFVDEGQDYSVFQYEYIKKLFPRARMTVLGDFGQAIYMQSTELAAANSSLTGLYGEKETKLIRLLQSYRSTREIVEFTRAMLPGGEEIIAFDRRDQKPQLIQTGTADGQYDAFICRDVARLHAEGFQSIAIITKTAAESRIAYESLLAHGMEKLKLITKETERFEKGWMVIPVYLAKGVEFDAVLVYDASAERYSEEYDRKLLYTACTRAMHRLHLYAEKHWSPFVQALPEGLYEKRDEV
ncbi:UvrD-helicase domain-containing protein [Paenibacillus barcinonensis]|uniref:DNA helicase-2/ATP-dependent DNA helicase PcrA n=1 Tax=Paenibacillus barcinonensis TaxID=198119 RepID=A0A2V4V6J3_PAEBA|nr:RNA polymerase recycling motor HelD [Paenibacillus barcinonensis]PYE47943.1 DNA helicase-2/ATP-dependent DNA helicase PcrA [Paenibacillus barcinonensis]QKS55068.1 UvrD-helicase domain-containing protein [Paenibacillus barcinonensis]